MNKKFKTDSKLCSLGATFMANLLQKPLAA